MFQNLSTVNANSGTRYEQNVATYWTYGIIYVLIGGTAVIGNGFVLLVTHGNRNSGPLRHLDNVIKSLAVADMLFGLLGIPLRLFVDYNIGT